MADGAADITALIGELDVAADRERVRIRRSEVPDDLNNYAILTHIDLARKHAMVEAAQGTNVLNRVMGSMMGMAVGDSIGHPYEFLPAQDVPGEQRFDLATMTFHGESNAFGLARGQWTDDAAMGLCMADSLILKRGFDGSDIRVRFWCWWNRGYNNAFRKDPSRRSSVGLGGNISKSLDALSRLKSADPIHPFYDAKTEDAGNGSLMRFTPVPIFFHGAPVEVLHEMSRDSSYTTHPGIIAAESCAFLAHLIQRALALPEGGVDPKRFLDEGAQSYWEVSGLEGKSGWGYDQMKWLVSSTPVNDTERCWNWKCENLDIASTLRARGKSYNGYPVSAGYFGSYCMDGLAMALWGIYHTRSFDEAVIKCINLLGDADSHGSICGQLAGALYGYRNINPQFIEWVNQWDDHEFAVRGLMLHHLGIEWAAEFRAKAQAQAGEPAS